MRCPVCHSDINIKPRSSNQSRYYFGQVVAPIAEHTGHSALEIHEILKQMFIPKEVLKISGVEYTVARSTTDLTTVEMEQYLALIRAWAGIELGVSIMLPNEYIND